MLDFDSLEGGSLLPSVLAKLNGRTNDFIFHRLNLLKEVTDGNRLRTELKIPYMTLPVPDGNWGGMLEEAFGLQEQFVSHRSSDSAGWKSVCLHGIDTDKTLSCDRYGFASEKETPYQWTSASSKCPMTTAWLKSLKELGYFTEFYRVRYMWLEPKGFIRFHRDRLEGQNSLGPLNVALNMPEGCKWLFKKWGEVPFTPGSAIAVDVSNLHGVWNNSSEDRVHIIIHGKYGPTYFKAIAAGRKDMLEKMSKTLTTPSNEKRVDQDFRLGVWRYFSGSAERDLEKKCFRITEHFLKLKSAQGFKIISDYSFRRILLRALEQNVRWAVLVAPGTIVNDAFMKSVRKLLATADPSVFLFGHLLDKGERGYGLHQQMIVVDVNKWALVGQPVLGFAGGGEQDVVMGERSLENVHDNYTPTFIKPGVGTRAIKDTVLGWNIINAALSNGYTVENLPDYVRNTKYHLYPEQNSKFLEKEIDSLSIRGSATYAPLTSTQILGLNQLRIEVEGYKKKLFIFNTEGTYELSESNRGLCLDQMYSLAAGFKDLSILRHHGSKKETELTYYDISDASLFLKKKIYESWDGNDFPNFVRMIFNHYSHVFKDSILSFDLNDLEVPWKKELEFWGGADKFKEVFEAARPLRKRYIKLDLLESPSWMGEEISKTEAKNIGVWYSNCFNYTPALALSDWNQNHMNDVGHKFLSSLLSSAQEKKKSIFMYGEDILSGAKAEHCGKKIEYYFQ